MLRGVYFMAHLAIDSGYYMAAEGNETKDSLTIRAKGSTMSVTRVPVFPHNLLSEPLLIIHVVQYYVQIRSMVNKESKER